MPLGVYDAPSLENPKNTLMAVGDLARNSLASMLLAPMRFDYALALRSGTVPLSSREVANASRHP